MTVSSGNDRDFEQNLNRYHSFPSTMSSRSSTTTAGSRQQQQQSAEELAILHDDSRNMSSMRRRSSNYNSNDNNNSGDRPSLRRQRSLLPPATKVVSEGFIEIVFLFLGIGVLLPWNAYINAKRYFESRLCDEASGKPIIESIEGLFSIIYNGSCVLSLAVVILIQYYCSDKEGNGSNGVIPTAPTPVIDTGIDHHSTNRRVLTKSPSAVSVIFQRSKNLYSPMSTRSLRVDRDRGSANYTFYMVMLPLAAYLAVFFVTTVLVFIPAIPPKLFATLTLSGLFICGVCTAAASSGIVGTAGLFDSNIGVNPYFNGQAVGGLFVAMANFLAVVLNGSSNFSVEFCGLSRMATSDTESPSEIVPTIGESGKCLPYSDVSWATAGYFSMGCLILAACMLGYSYIDEYKRLVRRNSFASATGASTAIYSSIDLDDDFDSFVDDDDNDKDQIDDFGHGTDEGDGDDNDENSKPRLFTHLSIDAKSIDDTTIDEPPGDNNENGENGDIDARARNLSKWRKQACVTFSSYQNDEPNHIEHLEVATIDRQSSNGSDTTENTHGLTLSVWYSVRSTAISLFLVYFCTLTVFPVWTSELISIERCKSSMRIQNDLFTPLSFVIFNFGDLVGRTMSSSVDITKVRRLSAKLVCASILRMVFFAAFLFCQAKDNRFGEWVVQNDWFSWLLQFFFAWTNGFMTNIAFCYAPTLVENKTNPQQVASAILNFALSFGLLVGSFFAYPYLAFAQTH